MFKNFANHYKSKLNSSKYIAIIIKFIQIKIHRDLRSWCPEINYYSEKGEERGTLREACRDIRWTKPRVKGKKGKKKKKEKQSTMVIISLSEKKLFVYQPWSVLAVFSSIRDRTDRFFPFETF